MIKVHINGTPIYKLCFSRRKYKTVNKKKPTAGQIIAKVKADAGIGTNFSKFDFDSVSRSIRDAFGGKPLYETTALVYIADAKTGEPPVATASTRQSRRDDNSRDTGREVALGRLLRTKPDKNGSPAPFNAIERAAIRAAYDGRTRKPKPPSPPVPAGSAPIAQLRRIAPTAQAQAVGRVLQFVKTA